MSSATPIGINLGLALGITLIIVGLSLIYNPNQNLLLVCSHVIFPGQGGEHLCVQAEIGAVLSIMGFAATSSLAYVSIRHQRFREAQP